MPWDERRGQRTPARKRRRASARREHERGWGASVFFGSSAPRIIRRARQYPIDECLIGEGWEESGLAEVLLTRRQPDGLIAFGNYLVDRFCLGLKNTFCNANLSRATYESKLKRAPERPYSFVPCPVPLAHEIIYGAIDYARGLGFRPHEDFALTRHVLEPRDRFPEEAGVEFGKDGMPFYIAGPRDNMDQVLRTLRRAVGEGNYHFLVPSGRPGPPEPEAPA